MIVQVKERGGQVLTEAHIGGGGFDGPPEAIALGFEGLPIVFRSTRGPVHRGRCCGRRRRLRGRGSQVCGRRRKARHDDEQSGYRAAHLYLVQPARTEGAARRALQFFALRDPAFFTRLHFEFSLGDVIGHVAHVFLVAFDLVLKVFEVDVGGAGHVVLFDELRFGELEAGFRDDQFFTLSLEPFAGPIEPRPEVFDLRRGGAPPQLRKLNALAVALFIEDVLVSRRDAAFFLGAANVFFDLDNFVDDLIARVDGDVQLVLRVEEPQFVLDGDFVEDVGVDAQPRGGAAAHDAREQDTRQQEKRSLDAHGGEAIIQSVRSQGRICRQRVRNRIFRWVARCVVFVALASPGGCSDDADSGLNPACQEDLDIRDTFVPDVQRRGSVTIRDVVDTSLGSDGEQLDIRQGRIQGNFGTVTATGAAARLQDLGLSCVGLTSLPAVGTTVRQTAGALRIEGLADGDVIVEPDGSTRYIETGAPYFGAAGPTLRASAPGGDFPGFSIDVPAVQTLQLRAPATDGTARLLPGELVVEWSAGDADFVEVRVTPVSDEPSISGGQVICRVADDGCFTLPASATSFLLSNNTRTYTFRVQRANVRVAMPDAETAVQMSALSEVRATLQNGVLQ